MSCEVHCSGLGVLALLALLAGPALGQDVGWRGVDLFDAACSGCHVHGQGGAPKIGDRAAWSASIARGLPALTRHAIEGIRSMPPHREYSSLNDLEITRAIVFMVNESGGSWPEPAGATRPAGERSGPQVTRAFCLQCHSAGYADAPKDGDHAVWVPRLALGLDPLVRAVVRGHGDMPSRGGQANLGDAEIRNAVIYMAGSRRGRAAAEKQEKAAGR